MRHKSFVNFSILVLVLSFSLVGCFSLFGAPLPQPDPNYIYNYAGNWQGSLTEQASKPRSATVSITILPHNFTSSTDYVYSRDYHYDLNGTWLTEFDADLKAIGVFNGYADAYSNNFNAQLIFGDDTNCRVSVTATRVGNTISGIYTPDTYASCTFRDIKVGTFQITKQ